MFVIVTFRTRSEIFRMSNVIILSVYLVVYLKKPCLKVSKKKRLRFNADDDLCLLRAVVRENPLQDPDKWETIKKNILLAVTKEFPIRTLKQHLQILLDTYKEKDTSHTKMYEW
jgi:hypothetical protein